MIFPFNIYYNIYVYLYIWKHHVYFLTFIIPINNIPMNWNIYVEKTAILE